MTKNVIQFDNEKQLQIPNFWSNENPAVARLSGAAQPTKSSSAESEESLTGVDEIER